MNEIKNFVNGNFLVLQYTFPHIHIVSAILWVQKWNCTYTCELIYCDFKYFSLFAEIFLYTDFVRRNIMIISFLYSIFFVPKSRTPSFYIRKVEKWRFIDYLFFQFYYIGWVFYLYIDFKSRFLRSKETLFSLGFFLIGPK